VLSFERLDLNTFPWEKTHAGLADGTIFQSSAWLNFLTETQRGEPVLAVLKDGPNVAGYFTGMVVRKFGLKILGSPFPGWSTSYMGLNLQPAVCKRAALDALKSFAFRDLGCAHVEFMDRKVNLEDIRERGFQWTLLNGFEVNLSPTEEDIFGSFHPSCRQAIRKGIRLGIAVEEAHDAAFAHDYYVQLEDVFAKQGRVPTYNLARVRELIRHIQPTGNLLLLRARDPEGRCIATGIFLSVNPTSMYFWGGASWRPYQILRPNELLMWTAMRIAKARGTQAFDMGGAGEYKRKYGGRPISIPWVRISSQPLIPILRNTARTLFTFKQRLQAKARWTSPAAPPVASPHSGTST
jgi:Acetyltransferase (GNAT) domain